MSRLVGLLIGLTGLVLVVECSNRLTNLKNNIEKIVGDK